MDNFDPFGGQPAFCSTCKKQIGLIKPVEKACSCDPFEGLRNLLSGLLRPAQSVNMPPWYESTIAGSGHTYGSLVDDIPIG